jgi:chromate reductase
MAMEMLPTHCEGEDLPAPAIRVAALVGSRRPGSLNRALLSAAREVAPGEMVIVNVDPFGLPFYDAVLEADGASPAVRSLKAAIEASDALLVITPEYNGGMPAVLKNALDWASRPAFRSPLADKPVLVMSASPGRSGGRRAIEDATRVLTATRSRVHPASLGVPGAGDLLDEGGRIADESLRADVAALLRDFASAVGGARVAARVAA